MVHDESSFDITAVPGIRVPPDYRRHFVSFDGRIRSFAVEGVGGPSWYTEYNVLTGLSVKSFGRFAYFVTQIAADRVERGLPRTLARCGYQTHTLYPWPGAFLGARSFQKSTGIEHFVDGNDMGADGLEPIGSSTIKPCRSSNASGARTRFSSSCFWRPIIFPGVTAIARS